MEAIRYRRPHWIVCWFWKDDDDRDDGAKVIGGFWDQSEAVLEADRLNEANTDPAVRYEVIETEASGVYLADEAPPWVPDPERLTRRGYERQDWPRSGVIPEHWPRLASSHSMWLAASAALPFSEVAVVADLEALSYIAERGGRLYVYADASGLKHVKTDPPNDPAIRFKQVEAVSFLFYVADDIQEPESWSVTFHHLPYRHVDVLWDGRQPGDAHNSVYGSAVTGSF